jgi:hypothetical protein
VRHDDRLARLLRWPKRLAIALAVFAAATVLADGFEYRDEIEYRAVGKIADGEVVVALQNTGSADVYGPFLAVKRYGPPFNLIVDWAVPSESQAIAAELQGVVIRAGKVQLLSIPSVPLPIETVEYIKPARQVGRRVSYFRAEPFSADSQVLVVEGVLVLHQPAGKARVPFHRELKRYARRGLSRGA